MYKGDNGITHSILAANDVSGFRVVKKFHPPNTDSCAVEVTEPNMDCTIDRTRSYCLHNNVNEITNKHIYESICIYTLVYRIWNEFELF